jgi:hypothetical protein
MLGKLESCLLGWLTHSSRAADPWCEIINLRFVLIFLKCVFLMINGRLHSHPAVALALRAGVPSHFWGSTAEYMIDFQEFLVSTCRSCKAESITSTSAIKLIVTTFICSFVFVCLEASQSVGQLHRGLSLGVLEASTKG